MSIKGKVAIVTGGIRGIGYATVQLLLKSGAKHVAIFDLPKNDDELVVTILNILRLQYGSDKVEYFCCDITKKDTFLELYKIVDKNQGSIDILMNNAGVLKDNKPDLITDVNYKALVNCCLVAITHMGKHKGGKGGVIINIGSDLGLDHRPLAPIYSGIKHAVVAFTRCFKDYTESLGIRMLCVCPGITKTGMTSFDELKNSLLDFVPDNMLSDIFKSVKPQNPDNVAQAVIQIIEKGRGGEVWLVHNDEVPVKILEQHYLERTSPIN